MQKSNTLRTIHHEINMAHLLQYQLLEDILQSDLCNCGLCYPSFLQIIRFHQEVNSQGISFRKFLINSKRFCSFLKVKSSFKEIWMRLEYGTFEILSSSIFQLSDLSKANMPFILNVIIVFYNITKFRDAMKFIEEI